MSSASETTPSATEVSNNTQDPQAFEMGDFEFVDLRANYNKELLVRFYNDHMVPNFGQFEDELEDVEIWIELLENQKR